jgi:hypothetical protein
LPDRRAAAGSAEIEFGELAFYDRDMNRPKFASREPVNFARQPVDIDFNSTRSELANTRPDLRRTDH